MILDRHSLTAALKSVGSPKILVLGDIMLDRYSWGEVSRISPEAPIPVLRVRREESRLGGAANAMTNLAVLGARVTAGGFLGADANGAEVRKLFQAHGIEAGALSEPDGLPTILKHRMIAGHHHLLRMDFDPPEGWGRSRPKGHLDKIAEALEDAELVVISDYGKGAVDEDLLNLVREHREKHGTPVIVDPKVQADYETYKGFTAIKPNRLETEAAVGFPLNDDESILKAAGILKERAGLEFLLLSLDKDGLLLYESEAEHHFLRAEEQEVFDVVGAGDMVVAVCAYLLAGGVSTLAAAEWANIAAGMEITHVGVVPFTKEELLERLESSALDGKVVEADKLARILRAGRDRVVFTNGYFDNISAGHLKYLGQLKKFKGTRVVAINSDASIMREKGEAPLLDQHERAQLLASIEAVDWVVVFDEKDASDLILKLAPATVVKGEKFKGTVLPEQPALEKVGAEIHHLPEY